MIAPKKSNHSNILVWTKKVLRNFFCFDRKFPRKCKFIWLRVQQRSQQVLVSCSFVRDEKKAWDSTHEDSSFHELKILVAKNPNWLFHCWWTRPVQCKLLYQEQENSPDWHMLIFLPEGEKSFRRTFFLFTALKQKISQIICTASNGIERHGTELSRNSRDNKIILCLIGTERLYW